MEQLVILGAGLIGGSVAAAVRAREAAEAELARIQQQTAAVNAQQEELKARLTTSGVLVNSIGMELKLIPAGTFSMGSENGDGDEQPVHQVTITRPYYVGIYEVTNGQWKQVMSEVPSRWKDEDLPIESVTWEEAVAFCEAL